MTPVPNFSPLNPQKRANPCSGRLLRRGPFRLPVHAVARKHSFSLEPGAWRIFDTQNHSGGLRGFGKGWVRSSSSAGGSHFVSKPRLPHPLGFAFSMAAKLLHHHLPLADV